MSSEFTSREFTSRTTSSWTILPIYRLIRDQGPICDGMEARVSLREFVTKPKQKPNVVTAGLDTEQKGEDNELEDIVVEEIEEHAVAHSRAELRNQLTSAANQEEISNEGQQVLRLLRDAGVEVEYVPDKNDSRISWPKLVPPATNFNYNVVGKTGPTLPRPRQIIQEKLHQLEYECMVDFDPIFVQWSKEKMLEFCKQCRDLAKFIMAKEYTNIIEYDKEYQHLKYLYENQKKKYKMYQQALNSNIELHKLKRTSDIRPSTSNSTVSQNISKISLRS